jgi:hypothetical protein
MRGLGHNLVSFETFLFLHPRSRVLGSRNNEIRPRDGFLITIRDRVQDPYDFSFRLANSAFPELEDTPSLPEQLVFVPNVSRYILVEFQLPEFFSSSRCCGISAARMPVPKAAVNKNTEVVARKHDVWFAWKLPRMQAISETMPVQQLPDLHFGRCITAANTGHHPRSDFFTDYVHD